MARTIKQGAIALAPGLVCVAYCTLPRAKKVQFCVKKFPVGTDAEEVNATFQDILTGLTQTMPSIYQGAVYSGYTFHESRGEEDYKIAAK